MYVHNQKTRPLVRVPLIPFSTSGTCKPFKWVCKGHEVRMLVLTLYKRSKTEILARGAVVRFYTTVLTLGREKKVFWRTFFSKKVEVFKGLGYPNK